MAYKGIYLAMCVYMSSSWYRVGNKVYTYNQRFGTVDEQSVLSYMGKDKGRYCACDLVQHAHKVLRTI